MWHAVIFRSLKVRRREDEHEKELEGGRTCDKKL